MLLRCRNEELFARRKMLANGTQRDLCARRDGLRSRRELTFVGEIEERVHDRLMRPRRSRVPAVLFRLFDGPAEGGTAHGVHVGIPKLEHVGNVFPATSAWAQPIAKLIFRCVTLVCDAVTSVQT